MVEHSLEICIANVTTLQCKVYYAKLLRSPTRTYTLDGDEIYTSYLIFLPVTSVLILSFFEW